MATTLAPPFRADQVGSLARPAHLLEARLKHDKGELPSAELARIEDAEDRKSVV